MFFVFFFDISFFFFFFFFSLSILILIFSLLFLKFQNGERGYLEGLASRYADLFNTHYGDVLEHLEELRRREWDELSPRIRVIQPGTPGTPPGTYSPTRQLASVSLHGLTTSLSQPIYVPGKYSVSGQYTIFFLSEGEENVEQTRKGSSNLTTGSTSGFVSFILNI